MIATFNRIILIASTAFLFAACAGLSTEERVQAWVGKPESELLARIGALTNMFNAALPTSSASAA